MNEKILPQKNGYLSLPDLEDAINAPICTKTINRFFMIENIQKNL